MSLPTVYCENPPKEYLGCSQEFAELRVESDRLNEKVLAQVNDSEELVMLNNFARECNEYQYKKCSQDRISDIASWSWVLEDLAKRLDEAVQALQYEHNTLRVVVHRVQTELDERFRAGSLPGEFSLLTDVVEDAIMQEYNFLYKHKMKFEKMILDLEKEIKTLNKIKTRIMDDVVNKQRAISVEESCARIGVSSSYRLETCRKKKKRASTISRWQNRCASLKTDGLRVLGNAAIIRQQVRGARTHLSIAAQAYAAKVDSALRRRLHTNKIKLQDLKWQREEALRDYKSLEEELRGTEQNLVESLEQERVIEARLLDRSLRPPGELTRDDVDSKLRDERARLRNFSKQLRTNMASIASLQNHLADSMTRIDNCAEDLFQVICMDEERIRCRLGEVPECNCQFTAPGQMPATVSNSGTPPNRTQSETRTVSPLTSIPEENENENDYPFEVVTPTSRWENRCASLETAGLRALSKAAIIKQQMSEARTHLSIEAQAYSLKVHSALMQRLHTNKTKLHDLKWKRGEALRDYKSLDEKLTCTEHNLLESLEQERVIEAHLLEAHLIDRSVRPFGKVIRDGVDSKLRGERGRLRDFSKHLRTNMASIACLQNRLAHSMTRIDKSAEDLFQVICMDEERIRCRLGEVPERNCHFPAPGQMPATVSNSQTPPNRTQSDTFTESPLISIPEKN